MEDLDFPGEPDVLGDISCILGVVDSFGRYISSFVKVTGQTIISPRVIPIPDGSWSDTLVPTSRITPSGVAYRRIITGPHFRMDDMFDVPDSGTYTVASRKVDAPSYVGSAALEAHMLDLAAHGGGKNSGRVYRNSDYTQASATTADIPDMLMPMTVPEGNWAVKFGCRLLVPTSGQSSGVMLATHPGNVEIARHLFVARGTNDIGHVYQEIPMPLPPTAPPFAGDWWRPNPGDVITLKLRLVSSAVNHVVSVSNAILLNYPCWLEWEKQ
jgi:hypothetical protein